MPALFVCLFVSYAQRAGMGTCPYGPFFYDFELTLVPYQG